MLKFYQITNVAQEKVFLVKNFFLRLFSGWNGACSISEFSGSFMGCQMNFKVTSTCGHVMGVDFPSKYNNWDRVDPIELFSCSIEKKEANPKLKMPAVFILNFLIIYFVLLNKILIIVKNLPLKLI